MSDILLVRRPNGYTLVAAGSSKGTSFLKNQMILDTAVSVTIRTEHIEDIIGEFKKNDLEYEELTAIEYDRLSEAEE